VTLITASHPYTEGISYIDSKEQTISGEIFMTIPEQPSQYGHGYVFDQESAAEKARLLLQDRLINEAIRGPIPEQKKENVQKLRDVLDVGCGPGGWALDVAKISEHIHVVGIDNSKTMIAHAQEEKKLHGLKNIEFEEMNALQPLGFPDFAFDLVNIRSAVGSVPQRDWQRLLKECYRITKVGGILRLTEGDGMGLTNSPAYEKHHRLGTQAMHQFGYGFSPDGATLGITPMLSWLLKQAGYGDIGMQSYFFDFSYGTPLYSSCVQNIEVAFEAARPLLVQAGVSSQEEIEKLYVQVLEQIRKEDFRAMGYLLTAWGKRLSGA
jgi:ubiquinone/menaquinone biosynthesis C-methylase UbiE